MAQSERRKHTRVRTKECACAFAEVKLFMIRKPQPGEPRPLIDISQGGLAMATLHYVQPGTKVELWINFGGDKSTYKAKGEVRYSRKLEEQGDLWRTGLEFSHKDDELTRSIKFLGEKFV